MVEAALTVLGGALLYAGAHHLYLGTTRVSPQPYAQLAVMYFLLAGFVLASAVTYQSQEISAQMNIARLSMTMGILLWVALIWYVAFYTRSKPLLLLDFLTAAWVILLIRNISSPYSLLYADIAPIALVASVDSWWTAIDVTMLASLLFCFYANLQMFKRGGRQEALALVSGLSILVAASLADHLLNTRVIHALYLAPFGFVGFLLINSLYPILLDFRKRRNTMQTPVIFSLTFNPEQTPFDSKLSNFKLPAGDEPEMTLAQIPNSAARRGESPQGERGCPEGEGPLGREAVVVAVPEQGKKAGRQDARGDTNNERACQESPTPVPKRDQPALNTVSDNLIDIAVYATMALNRFKRGDADPQVQEMLCKKIRTKAIKTRRMANRLSCPGKPDNDAL